MDQSNKKTINENFPHFLADTWWYALSSRMSDDEFFDLVNLRQSQGFTAAQLVVGIPPEVGPENVNAKSKVGYAWDLKGNINSNYLKFAKQRIKYMNDHNLIAVIYGAWGNQIDWMGKKWMCQWWKQMIDTFSDLNVIFCLTGELDIWTNCFLAKALLPDNTTDVLLKNSVVNSLAVKNIYHKLHSMLNNKKKRKKEWSFVLDYISTKTNKPIILHTLPNTDAFSSINNNDLLSANTIQTGHSIESETMIWKQVYKLKNKYPKIPIINLEPWYEGINNSFYLEDQLKAFWLSVTAGVHSICYGAHGIWNVGDGQFLSHWGDQSFSNALKLQTPDIIGKAYQFVSKKGILNWNHIEIKEKDNKLIYIIRKSSLGEKIIYIPELNNCDVIPEGDYFDVYQNKFLKSPPSSGQLVILINNN